MVQKTRKKQVVVQLQPAKAKKKNTKRQQEVSAVGKALRALGGIGGSAMGSYLGDPFSGGVAGTGLAAALSKWLGFGDYTVSSNSLVQKASSGGMIPAMHKEGQSIIVRHREFLTEVTSNTAFTVKNQFFLNPGLAPTFPWLSGLAAQYSEYRIRGMVFHYVPTSGNAVSSTNAALGSVMLQTSYRATETVPASKVELLNEYWASEAKPSEEFCHPIECDPRENPFNVQYIRYGALPATENQLMYDLGRTTLAVSGQQADNITLGDLWITYEIELKKPVLTNAGNATLYAYGGKSTTAVGTGNPFGSLGNWSETFSSFPTPVTVTATTMTFGAGVVGTFQISCFYTGATAFQGAAWGISNGTFVNAIAGSASLSSVYSVGTGAGVNLLVFTISDPARACVITANLTTCTGATAVRAYIAEANPSCTVP